MKIMLELKNTRTHIIKKVTIDDAVSPASGYSQSYADRVGAGYAAERAAEQLNTPSSPNDKWLCIRAFYPFPPRHNS